MGAVQLAGGGWRVPTAPDDLVGSSLPADDDGSLTLVDAGVRSGTSGARLAVRAFLAGRPA